MVEVLGIDPGPLPSGGGVALRAVGSESSLMLVLMAGDATGRQTKPGTIQLLGGEFGTRLHRNVLRCVAGAAAYADVLAVESIPGLGVIETLRRWVPMYEGKVLAVVIGVALDTSCSPGPFAGIASMKAPVLYQLGLDLLMAIDAAKGRRPGGNLVALYAIGGSVQAPVCPGQRPRRNLGMSGRDGHPNEAERECEP